jgi:hypothetical protein
MAGDAAVIANQARSEMTLTNGGAFQAANLYLGNIAGTGTLNVFSAGQVTLTGALIAGSSSGPTGIVNVDGTSSLVTSNGATIGSGGIGIVNLTNGGTFNAGTTMVVGSTAGSSGSLTIQNGGTTDFGGAVGDSAGSQGTATVGAPSLISLSPSSTGRRSAKPSDLRQRRCARLLTASTTIRQSGWGWTACKAQGDARTPRELRDVIIRVARGAWIPERSATCLREADLNVLSKLGNQGLEGRLEPEAFTRREVGREDDLLDVLVGCPVDIQVARQPST